MERTARTTTEEQLLTGLLENKLQLWTVGGAAVAITMIADYPNFNALAVVLLAGTRMTDWLATLELRLEQYGRDHGCTELEAWVRPAMAGAIFRPHRAALKDWRPEVTLVRRTIPAIA